MKTLVIFLFIIIIAITSCNNNNSNSSNTDSNNATSSNNNSICNTSKTTSSESDNNSSKEIVDNNKRETKTAIRTDYEISVGSSFTIELVSNPTTGYRWHWINRNKVNTIDTTGYRYVGDSPGKMGSGGKEIWTFTAKRTGTDTIKFQYSRSWQKNSETNTKIYSVKVT